MTTCLCASIDLYFDKLLREILGLTTLRHVWLLYKTVLNAFIRENFINQLCNDR